MTGRAYSFPRILVGMVPLVMLLALVVLQLSALDSAADAAYSTYGSISGTVTDQLGNPVANADVSLSCLSRYPIEPYPLVWVQCGYTKTDASGSFVLTNLTGGDYRITFGSSTQNLLAVTTQQISLLPGQNVTGFNVVLPPGGSISGIVTDAAGQPLPGAHVSLLSCDGCEQYTVTDADGRYSFIRLNAGQYKIRFDANGNYVSEYYSDKLDFDSASTVSLVAGDTISGIDASLAAGAVVSGRVTDETGNPLSPVYVHLYRFDAASSSWKSSGFGASTDAAGNYSIDRLPAGQYKALFFPAVPDQNTTRFAVQFYSSKANAASGDVFSVATGATLTGIDAVLNEGSTISGHVSNEAGAPIAGVGVFADPQNYSDYQQQPRRLTYTDANGDYTIAGLAPGQYSVGYSATNYYLEYYNDQSSTTFANLLAIAANSHTSGIDAVLTAIGSCSGDKPSIKLNRGAVYWASYSDYAARNLTIDYAMVNTDNVRAAHVKVTGTSNSNGVTLVTSMPHEYGDISGGSSISASLVYYVPDGVAWFRTVVLASASDLCGKSFTYP